MEREDPLEKFERRESERKANGPLKTVMYVMIVVAVALAAALAYVLVSKNSLVEELNFEKMELAAQLDSLQADYEGLSSAARLFKGGGCPAHRKGKEDRGDKPCKNPPV